MQKSIKLFLIISTLFIFNTIQSTLIFGPNGYNEMIQKVKENIKKGNEGLQLIGVRYKPDSDEARQIREYFFEAIFFLREILVAGLEDISNNILLRAYLAANGLFDKNYINSTDTIIHGVLAYKIYTILSDLMHRSNLYMEPTEYMTIYGKNGYQEKIFSLWKNYYSGLVKENVDDLKKAKSDLDLIYAHASIDVQEDQDLREYLAREPYSLYDKRIVTVKGRPTLTYLNEEIDPWKRNIESLIDIFSHK